MTTEPHSITDWLSTTMLAEDDTEESVMGSDWHQEAIFEAHGPLLAHAAERVQADPAAAPWYVSSQVTVIVPLPRRDRPWQLVGGRVRCLQCQAQAHTVIAGQSPARFSTNACR